MASRLGRRVFAQVSRPTLRSSRRNVNLGAGRRWMSGNATGGSSTSNATSTSVFQEGDRPWQIGSAVITGLALFFILSPSSKQKAHKQKEHKHEKPAAASVPAEEDISTPLPVKDDEGTEVSVKEIKESLQTAFDANSPKDAQVAEEKQTSEDGPALVDVEGTVASPAELNTSIDQAIKEDSPKEAQEAEAITPQQSTVDEEQKPQEDSGPVTDLGERSKAVETLKDTEASA